MAGLYYKVNTQKDPLALREGESATSKNLASMPKGAIVAYSSVMSSTDPNWTPVIYNGQAGYASSQYLTIATEAEYNAYKNGGSSTSNTTNNVITPSPDSTTNDGTQKTDEPNGKAWMIAGCVVMALGAVVAMFKK